ncbi:MAG: Holliday junction resolvase RuvX [Bifidobacteriaceae bacterium]|jgi:putative Holliday junction resolvase|nr:Holliday junction resolvase RuvX [Bifidobacteriaceae bacterium]
MSKSIAIDMGKKRIGLAIADNTLNIPIPYETIFVNFNEFDKELINFDNDDTAKIVTTITDIFESENITRVFFGLPLSLDGEEGISCQNVRNFCKVLIASSDMEHYFIDERFTTSAAITDLKTHMNSKKQKNVVDQVAALKILETALSIYN